MKSSLQLKLESILGRPFTEQEIETVDVLITNRDDGQLANILYGDKKTLVSTEVGNGLILNTIGLEAGNKLLDYFKEEPLFRYIIPLLEQGRLDVSSGIARAALDQFALAGLISSENAAALKALAEQPVYVDTNTVSAILNSEV